MVCGARGQRSRLGYAEARSGSDVFASRFRTFWFEQTRTVSTSRNLFLWSAACVRAGFERVLQSSLSLPPRFNGRHPRITLRGSGGGANGNPAMPQSVELPGGVAFREADIYSEGVRISADIYFPKTATGTLPTIIMAPGWGGTASGRLRPTAIDFADAGFFVVAFDYRGWGDSDSRANPHSSTERSDQP